MNSQFQDVLKSLLDSDNNTRKQAEIQLEVLCRENTIQTIEALLQAISGTDVVSSTVALTVLKKNILTNKQIFLKLNASVAEEVLKNLSELIKADTRPKLLTGVAEIVSLIFHYKGEYVEFFNFLDTFKTSAEKSVMLFVIACLDEITPFIFSDELLSGNSSRYEELFGLYLQSQHVEVKIAAACAFMQFISCINENSLIVKYKQPFGTVIDIMIEAIKSDEEYGSRILQSMADLTAKHPAFLKDFLERILEIYTEIVAADGLSNTLRSSALDNIVELASAQTAPIKKSKNFAQKTLGILLSTLMNCQEDDLSEWFEIPDDAIELNAGNLGSHIIQVFSKLNDILGVKYLMPKVLPSLASLIPNSNWKAQYSGLMAISMIFTGCKEHFEGDLENFTKLVIPTIQSQHPKVLYASMTAIALLSEEFTPDVQEKHCQLVLTAASKIISTNEHSKLRLRAISMSISFLKELITYDEEKDCVLPYMPDLISAVVAEFEKSFNTSNFELLEEILNLLAIFAGVMEENFGQYYKNIMPGLINLLESTPNTSEVQNKLRFLVISTMGHMIGSFLNNPAEIKNDIVGIMEKLAGMQNSIADDDSQHKAILEVYQIMVKVLGDEYSVFLPQTFEQIVRCANRDVQLTIEDNFNSEKLAKPIISHNKAEVDLGMLGGRKILSVNHEFVEQKNHAVYCIKNVCKVMKTALNGQVEQLTQILKSNCDIKWDKGIKKNVFKALKHLLSCAESDEIKGSIFKQFQETMLQFTNEYLNVGNCEEAHYGLKKINGCLEQFKEPMLQPEFVAELINTMTLALEVSAKSKKEVLEEWGNPKEMDEIETEDFEYEYNIPNNLTHAVMAASMDLIKLFGPALEEIMVQKVGGYFFLQMKSPVVEDDIHYACCFYAEFFRFCSQEVCEKGYAAVMQYILPSALETETVNYQQSAGYLFGNLAHRLSREQFKPYLGKVHQYLSVLMERPDAWSEDREICTETILGAFYKLCVYQLDNSSDKKSQGELAKVLNKMPLKTDPEEAHIINKLFLENLISGNKNLSPTAEFEQKCKDILVAMKDIVENQQKLDILDNSGKQLLSQVLNS